jgi:hypothetical protein
MTANRLMETGRSPNHSEGRAASAGLPPGSRPGFGGPAGPGPRSARPGSCGRPSGTRSVRAGGGPDGDPQPLG